MLNPMLIAKVLPMIKPLKVIMNAKNPYEMLTQMADSSPLAKQTIDIMEKYGNDPQKAFLGLCDEVQINPTEFLNNDILNMFK